MVEREMVEKQMLKRDSEFVGLVVKESLKKQAYVKPN